MVFRKHNQELVDAFLNKRIPEENTRCLCGSGQTFGHCCIKTYESVNMTSSHSDTDDAQLRVVRAQVTRYSIWHRQKTVFLVEENSESAERWMEMDIAALSDYVSDLLLAYKRNVGLVQFRIVLERLRENINDLRWQRKIVYFQAFTLMMLDDEGRARTELLKLAPFDNESDPEVLQLYLDLFRRVLSFGERQNVIQQLLKVTDKAVDRLQYKCLKAIDHFLINDAQSAKKFLDTAITEFRCSDCFLNPSIYALNRYAGALELHGNLNSDQSSIDESIKVFRTLTIHPNLTNFGRADVYRQLGELYRSQALNELAQDSFNKAIELHPMPICQILLASSLIATCDFLKARDILGLVEPVELSHEEMIDYAFVWFELAYKSNQKLHAEKALVLLRELTIDTPYFVQLQKEMIIALLDLQAGVTGKLDSTLWQKLEVLTKYVNLKPGMFGLSIDINKFIIDQAKKIK